MPSRRHEELLRLFQNRPALAAEVASEVLHERLPEFSEAHVESANLNDLRPAEYQADLVVVPELGRAVQGIIVEVQLSPDEDKKYTWPAYVCNLRNRIRSPVGLLVVAADDVVARWAHRTIDLGGFGVCQPWVLSPSIVPEITDESRAKQDPELAVLSAIAHGADSDIGKVVRIAQAAHAAVNDLDTDRSTLYSDMLMSALSAAAREGLQTVITHKYEYQTEFARRYYGQGLTEGRAKGRAEDRADLILRLLARRFGSLSDSIQAAVRQASIEELDVIGERLLTADTLSEALAPR